MAAGDMSRESCLLREPRKNKPVYFRHFKLGVGFDQLYFPLLLNGECALKREQVKTAALRYYPADYLQLVEQREERALRNHCRDVLHRDDFIPAEHFKQRKELDAPLPVNRDYYRMGFHFLGLMPRPLGRNFAYGGMRNRALPDLRPVYLPGIEKSVSMASTVA